MSAQNLGCFSWLERRKKKHKKVAEKQKGPVKVVEYSPGQEEQTDKAPEPSKADYAVEATRRTIEILSGVAGLVGVPLVKEVLDIGLSLITTCETINEVQERVSELKNRVASFLLVIAKIAKAPEDNGLLKTSHSLMEELQDLKVCLSTITTRLEAISKQNIFLTTLLPDSNLKTIEECVNSFQDGINRFQTLRGIHAAQDLTRIQDQLEEIYGLTQVVVKKVNNIEVEVREMKSSVDQLRAMLERTDAEIELPAATTRMPSAPGIFFGRDAVVNRIAETFSSQGTKPPRICILGPGGMGKTSTALAVMNHQAVKARFPTKNLVWVPCVSLTSPGALLAYLARRLGTAGSPDPLEAICNTLEQNNSPFIILLDNFETPWHPSDGEQAFTRQILEALDTLTNISILVTMRSDFPPLSQWRAERLHILTIEDSRSVYRAIRQKEEDDEDLDPLLDAVGHLPYAITLIATQAKYASASPKQMLAEWRALGTEMLTDVEDSSKSMDSSIELSVGSKYVTSSPGAIELLQVLSLLPGGVYQDDISVWMKSWRLSALSTLRNAALVVARELELDGAEKTHLLVLPVVQSYMKRLQIPADVCLAIQTSSIDFLCARKSMIEGPDNLRYRVDKPEIEAQEVNLQAIIIDLLQELQAPDSAVATEKQLNALITFTCYQNWTRPRLDIAEQVLAVAERSDSSAHLAEALLCFALQRSSLFVHTPNTITLFERARDLFISLGNPLKGCLADYSILFCAQDSKVESGNHEELLALSAAMSTRWEPYYDEYPVIHGLVMGWTAHLLWLLAPENAPNTNILQDLLASQEIFAANHRPYDLQRSQFLLVRYYLGEKKYPEAREVVEKALELTRKEALPPLSPLHLGKARAMKEMDEWGSGLCAVLEEGLSIARREGLPYDIALLLDELGEVYVRDGDWYAARLAYDTILKECQKSSPGWSINDAMDRTRRNLQFVDAKLGKGKASDSDDVAYTPPLRW